MAQKIVDISTFKVMKKRCKTCPFNENGGTVRAMVELRVITEASQICHHPRLQGKKENKICRGGRDYQLKVFYQIGWIGEPTDKAWEEALKESLKSRNSKNSK